MAEPETLSSEDREALKEGHEALRRGEEVSDEAIAVAVIERPKVNPYVEKLARELLPLTDMDAATMDPVAIAQRFYDEYLVPKNARIHDLTAEVARLKADCGRLGKVLARHNAGVCKDGESPIDCAIRLLSPVRDDTPKRDRP